MTEKSTTTKLALEASNLCGRLYLAYMNEDDNAGDPRRIARLLRLARMAGDRWRRIVGIEPVYGKGGTPR